MTQSELREFVNLAYATYALQIAIIDRDTIYEAWWNMLGDLEAQEAKAAFQEIAIFAEFLPRPGAIRRRVIEKRAGEDEWPQALEAWGILQQMRRATETGTQYGGGRPAPLLQTIQEMGGMAGTLHTNGDRETFVRVYNRVLQKMELERYKINTPTTVVYERTGTGRRQSNGGK